MIKKKSESDWAIELIREKKEPVFYKDLLIGIAEKTGRAQDATSLSNIYTRINMDNRLTYQGEGYWFFDNNRLESGGKTIEN
ncbi:MAG: DNA-directed RNA polymerase subunit delta [Syntrophomonadaceae bacterium]|jgi:DNA-directed RNA polymerase subunit delta|nr:DNA-directed RNA polymerase subunit delta [Syntrophomonadaceae bacterium]